MMSGSRNIAFCIALVGGGLALVGGRLDGVAGDRLSQIAAVLILLPLGALLVAAIWARFSGIVVPVEEGLRSIEGVSWRYARPLSIAVAVLAMVGSGYFYAVVAGHEQEAKEKALCLERMSSYALTCTEKSDALCSVMQASLSRTLCEK